MQKITRWLTLISLIATMVAFASPSASISAQTGEITYNAAVEGLITTDVFEQQWTLNAQGADRIRVYVERTDGNLIPDLWLKDAGGADVDRSYGADATGAAALIDSTDLPSAGTYTILVTRAGGADGATTGSYRLIVTPLGLAEDNPELAAITGPVTYDTPITGTISQAKWQVNYTLSGEAGDAVAITVRRTNGILAPEVVLVDNLGQEVRRGFTNDTQESAEFSTVDLPYTGDYVVSVRRARGMDGSTTGEYELVVHLEGAGEDSARLNDVEPGAIEQYNTPVSGEITDALWRQDWQFRTEAQDRITIQVQRMPADTPETPNNLVPLVLLLDANGDELRRAFPSDTNDRAAIESFTVPSAGAYTVRVTRDREKDGATTGTYELTVVLNGSGVGSPFLANNDGVLELDIPVTGALTNSRWANTWTFSGEADQEIDFTVTRADGTLIPNLDIRDANGQSLRFRNAEATLDQAKIERFRLPYTGEYQIVVLRDRDQDGVTTGGYSLLAELYEEPQQ